MSGAAQALQGAIDLLTRFYESPSLAHTNALVLIDNELPVLRAALGEASSQAKQAAAARATACVAIGHLQAVLNKPRTHDEQRADIAAREWLASIGSEPT